MPGKHSNDVIDMDSILGGRNDLLRSRAFRRRLKGAKQTAELNITGLQQSLRRAQRNQNVKLAERWRSGIRKQEIRSNRLRRILKRQKNPSLMRNRRLTGITGVPGTGSINR